MAVTGRGAGGIFRGRIPLAAAVTPINSLIRSTSRDKVSTTGLYSDIRRCGSTRSRSGSFSPRSAIISSSQIASMYAEFRGR